MKKRVKIVVIGLVIIIVAIVTFLLVDFLLRKSSVEVSKNNSINQYNENDTIRITPQPVSQEEMEEWQRKIEENRQIPWEIRKHMSFDKVSMTVKEESVTKNGATFIITNNNEASCGHGGNYKIERKILGLWIPVLPIVTLWSLEEHAIILSKTSIEIKQDWTSKYGNLRNGKYRLGEEISINGQTQYIYAEFSI